MNSVIKSTMEDYKRKTTSFLAQDIFLIILLHAFVIFSLIMSAHRLDSSHIIRMSKALLIMFSVPYVAIMIVSALGVSINNKWLKILNSVKREINIQDADQYKALIGKYDNLHLISAYILNDEMAGNRSIIIEELERRALIDRGVSYENSSIFIKCDGRFEKGKGVVLLSKKFIFLIIKFNFDLERVIKVSDIKKVSIKSKKRNSEETYIISMKYKANKKQSEMAFEVNDKKAWEEILIRR